MQTPSIFIIINFLMLWENTQFFMSGNSQFFFLLENIINHPYIFSLHSILREIKMFKKSKGRSDLQIQKYFNITYLGSLPFTW